MRLPLVTGDGRIAPTKRSLASIALSSAVKIHRPSQLSNRARSRATVEDAAACEKVVEDFIKIHHAQSRPRTRDEQERLLTKHFRKTHRETALNRVTVKDILAITDGLKELPSEQLHAYRALKTLFKWAVTRKMIAESPLEGLARPNEPADRDRVLSDKELVAIYKAAQKVGYPCFVPGATIGDTAGQR